MAYSRGSMKKLIISIFIFIFLLAVSANAANLLLRDDFEEGNSWDYGDKWTEGDIDGKNAAFTPTTGQSPPSGSWCLYAKDELDGENTTLSFGYLPTNKNIFIRYWFKPHEPMTYCRFQIMRFTNIGGVDEIEVGGSYPCETSENWAHIYDPFNRCYTGWSPPLALYTGWHQYAVYLDYTNGNIMWWRDASEYTAATATSVCDYSSIGGPYPRVSLGGYFKSHWPDGPQYWEFWLDNVEIWDGIPGVPSNDPPSVNLSTQCPVNTGP